MGWTTSTIWRGPVLAAQTVTVPVNNQVIVGPWDVSTFSAIFVQLDTNTQGATLDVETSMDSTFGTPLDQMTWTVRQETGLRTVVPLIGNWARLVFTTPAGLSASYTGNLYVQPVNAEKSLVTYPAAQGDNGIFQSNLPLAVGETDTWYLPWVQPGLAHVLFDPIAGAKMKLQIGAQNPDGTFGPLVYYQFEPAGVVNDQLVLPAEPVLVTITNDATTSVHYTIGLTPGGGT